MEARQERERAVILRFWLVHHRMYEHVIDYSQWLLFTNSIWLFCIVSLPFPTELIGRSAGQGSVGNGLYIGTMLVASAAGLAGHWVLLLIPSSEFDRQYMRHRRQRIAQP